VSRAPVGPLARGRVYGAVLGDLPEKYFAVVSNNARNRALPSILAVRLTTAPKPEGLASVVRLGSGEVLTGWVCCDDIVEIWPDEVTRDLGALSPAAMTAVAGGLRAALAL
jgi:mRNA interferase MazF